MSFTCTRPLAVMSAARVAASCAGNPEGVVTPVAFSSRSPTAAKVEMLVATTRLASNNPSTLFNGERGQQPSQTDITVSIPVGSSRKIGDVQWPERLPPNPTTDFAVTSVDGMTGAQEGLDWFRRHGKGRTLSGQDIGLLEGATVLVAGTTAAAGAAAATVDTAPTDAAVSKSREAGGREFEDILDGEPSLLVPRRAKPTT